MITIKNNIKLYHQITKIYHNKYSQFALTNNQEYPNKQSKRYKILILRDYLHRIIQSISRMFLKLLNQRKRKEKGNDTDFPKNLFNEMIWGAGWYRCFVALSAGRKTQSQRVWGYVLPDVSEKF